MHPNVSVAQPSRSHALTGASRWYLATGFTAIDGGGNIQQRAFSGALIASEDNPELLAVEKGKKRTDKTRDENEPYQRIAISITFCQLPKSLNRLAIEVRRLQKSKTASRNGSRASWSISRIPRLDVPTSLGP